jgi:Uma2 family endonuclease
MTSIPNVKTIRQPLSPDERRQRQRDREATLAQLIYETDSAGKPIYYAGFQQVINNTKTPEDIMGASGLQSYLVDLVMNFFHLHPQAKTYRFLYNEIGVQIKKKQWRACDIAIYRRDRLKDYQFTNHYMNLPPDFVIEIDTKADLSRYKYQHDYFIEKTRELHEFGVKKVIWIFTENHPVIWESDSADTITIRQGWDFDVTVTEGMIFNLAQLITEDKMGE